MLLVTILYHLVMIAVDLAIIQRLSKTKALWHAAKILLLWDIVAAVFALLLGENGFGHMRLMSYGVLIHGPAILFASFLIFRSANMKAAVSYCLIAMLTSAAAVYAFFIEPHRLEETEYAIQNSKVTLPLKIAIVSDIQTDSFGDYERQALKRVLLEKPDLILLTGDYLQPSKTEDERTLHSEFTDCLRSIKFQAPHGVYAVRGDVDADSWKDLFRNLPVQTIERTTSFNVGGLRIRA